MSYLLLCHVYSYPQPMWAYKTAQINNDKKNKSLMPFIHFHQHYKEAKNKRKPA